MRRYPVQLLLILLIFCFSGISHAESRRLVLVTGTQQLDHTVLSQREIRRVFLGQAVEKSGNHITALINDSDPLLYQVFLQKVVFMSANAYERHLLSTVFRMGGTRPATYMNIPSLVSALRGQTGTISYMWEKSARVTPGVIIIGELWAGPID